MARSDQRCVQCAHYNTTDSTCHRRAPVLIALVSKDGVTRLTEWPPVRFDSWCGDFAHHTEEVGA